MKSVKIVLLNIKYVAESKEKILSYVDKGRAEKSARFIKEQDGLLSLGGAYLIKKYVGDFFVDDKGKPRAQSVFFNISHSHDLVGIALSDECEIGFDVEYARKEDGDVIAYCLSDEEMKAYKKGLPFLSMFVAKESLAKADGRGIIGNVKKIPALPADGFVAYGGKNFYRHKVEADGYFASVSLENKDFTFCTKILTEITF